MSSRPLLVVEDVAKEYEGGLVSALRGVSFEVQQAEIVAIIGPSGCGKSTLLSLISLLDRPDSGKISVLGRDISTIKSPYKYRAETIGLVFQFHHLIPTMTLAENIAAPMLALHSPRKIRHKRADELLEEMGLSHRSHFFPAKVSGGERQRVAIARALVNRPPLLMADEPTGNLDSENGLRVARLFLEHARKQQGSVVMATHNSELADLADRVITMRDGRITGGE